MSFYIGRHREGIIWKRQLHITDGIDDLSHMQGGVSSNTVFHSDVPYITYETYELTRNGYYWKRAEDSFNTNLRYDKYTTYSANHTLNSKIAARYAHVVVQGPISNGYFGSTMNFMKHRSLSVKYAPMEGSNSYVHTDTGLYSDTNYYTGDSINPSRYWANSTSGVKNDIYYGFSAPSNSYKYFSVRGDGPAFITFIVFNFKNDGTYDGIPNQNTASDILIGKGKMNVNGINIANMKFIKAGAHVNNVDPFIHGSGVNLQLVNYLDNGKDVKMESSHGNSSISVGNRKIIDSTKGSPGLKIIESGTTIISGGPLSVKHNHLSYPIGRKLTSGEIMFYTIYGGIGGSFSSGVISSDTVIANEPFVDDIHGYTYYARGTSIFLLLDLYRLDPTYVPNITQISIFTHKSQLYMKKLYNEAFSVIYCPSYKANYVILK